MASHRYPLTRKMPGPRFWTEDRVQRLRELAGQGLMAAEIAEAMGLTTYQISATAHHHEIEIWGLRAQYEASVAGNRFFEARKRLGWSIAQAAEELDVTEPTVRAWEHGSRPRNRYVKVLIRKKYGLEV